MENQNYRPARPVNERALIFFISVCVVVVIVILSLSFQRTDGGQLSGEIYRIQPTLQGSEP
jgi:hypothetical protein